MEDTIALDTNILVDLLREIPKTIKWIKEYKDKYELSTTIINVFELYAGAYKDVNVEKKISDINELLQNFKILDFSIKCAKEAGKQKAKLESQGLMIDRGDLFIGSIVLSNNLPLKTNNKKHFERIEGLRLV